jgi:hypothetical protein
MVTLNMFRATEVPPDALTRLREALDALPDDYQPILGPARDLQAKVMGVASAGLGQGRTAGRYAAPYDEVVVFGEVLVKDGAVLGVTSSVRGQSRYRPTPDGIVTIVSPDEAPAEVIAFSLTTTADAEPLEKMVEILGQRSGVEFATYRYGSRRFREMTEEGVKSPAAPTADELRASRLLADKALRGLAIAVKSSGGLLVSDAAKQLPSEAGADSAALIAKLQEAGLVDTEVVVICSKTNSQVARAASRKALERGGSSGITCACGKPLKEERIEEALTVTPMARSLLDGSRWMSVLLVDELVALGVPLDRILIEQQVGGFEMDCFADVSGELTFFELKDKEFSLGNAYSFGAKVAVSRPDHRVIITTEYVGNDAKEHFERAEQAERQGPSYEVDQAEPPRLTYIEGIDSLHDGLEELVSEIFAQDGMRLLRGVLPLASLEPQAFVAALRERAPAHADGDKRQAVTPAKAKPKPKPKPRGSPARTRSSSRK